MPVNKGSFPKIVVLGAASVGKTSIIEQVAYGNYYPEKVGADIGFTFYTL